MSDRTEAGLFAPGNRLWEARSSAGPKPKFKDPDQLWTACVEYFEWVEENPLWEEKGFAFQGVVTRERFAKMRAMTIGGLCIFLDIDETTWRDWKVSRSDLSPIITRVEQVIRDQKFSGAAADLLNANIIARDLGLADKQDHQSSDGSMTPKAGIDVSSLSDEALAEIHKAMKGDGSDPA
jgi:hypothetical protein